MRFYFQITLTLLLALLLFVGCETTKNIQGSITSTVDSMISDVDKDLFAQVPENQREGVQKAAFDLLVLNEKVKIAELKEELAGKQKKYANNELDLSKQNKKEAIVKLDIEKLEAIDRSGLGEKKDNIKTIADLKAKVLDIDSDKLKVGAKLHTTQIDIDNLIKQIKEMEEIIKNMKMVKE